MQNIEHIAGRIQAIASEAFSQCKGEYDTDALLMIATTLWSLSSAAYFSYAVRKGEFAEIEPKQLLHRTSASFKSWLACRDLIKLSDDGEKHATRFNALTSAMMPKLLDVLRSPPNRLAPEMDMLEATPELQAMIISDSEKGPSLFKAAIHAIYKASDDFRQTNFEGTDPEDEPPSEPSAVAVRPTSVPELLRALVIEKSDADTFGSMPLDDKRLFQMLAVFTFILKRGYAHGIRALRLAEKACRATHIGTGWRQVGKTRSALARALMHLKVPSSAREEPIHLINAASVVADQLVAKNFCR